MTPPVANPANLWAILSILWEKVMYIGSEKFKDDLAKQIAHEFYELEKQDRRLEQWRRS
jgi:hypothetical protein